MKDDEFGGLDCVLKEQKGKGECEMFMVVRIDKEECKRKERFRQSFFLYKKIFCDFSNACGMVHKSQVVLLDGL